MINLCFHGIGAPGRPLEPCEDEYWIEPDLYLAVLDLVAGRPDVSLSFDDGNASDHSLGLPGLLDRGLTARFFVVAGRLDQPGSLSSDDVLALQSAGMSIGNHGMDHIPWQRLSETEVVRELVEARDVLTRLTGRSITTAALPLGRYDRRTLRQLRQLGYERVFSSDRHHIAPDAWHQPRFSVRCDDTVQSLSRDVLSEHSPWQTLRRRARSLARRLR